MSPDLLGSRYFSHKDIFSPLLILHCKRLYHQQHIEFLDGVASPKQEQLGELQVAEENQQGA
jgi:hypothetical protein